jgi:ubiquinone/menaquinone biosynthesis C-methylase UbiE
MASQTDAIRDQQKANWNQFSQGWKKWDETNMIFLRPMGKEIIERLQLKETDHVLDIATGTGEPGLTIAKLVAKGKVTGQDLSEGMLETAMEHARAKGIANYETVCCDISELPFADNTFDAISCRMGFMFFPDMQKAADEMFRVLKPGGRIATSVWGAPAKNFWTAGLMGTISKSIEMPVPPLGSPSMFRCSQPGLIAELFRKSGLRDVHESEVNGNMQPGTFAEYWEMMTEVAAPVVAAMNRATEKIKVEIKTNLGTLMVDKTENGKLSLPFSSIVISGLK